MRLGGRFESGSGDYGEKLTTLKPTVITDGGPWAEHNMPCAVLDQDEVAVLSLNENVFQPSWKAQQQGWKLVRAKTRFQKFLLKRFF